MIEKKQNITISIDVMGGDNAPSAVIEGIDVFLSKKYLKNKEIENVGVKFLLFGHQDKIAPLIAKFPAVAAVSKIQHCSSIILADEKPSIALRKGKDSSMRKAVEAAKNKDADSVISAGNTGAFMAFSKILLGSLEAIDRPAITAVIPTLKGKTVFLDLGANSICDADNLFQFALMGDAFAKNILHIKSPKVGLLNIGSEEGKGHELLNVASQMLSDKSCPVNFYGFVEGNDIAEGTVDVIVTDGFTGNIALKTMEGTAKVSKFFLEKAFKKSLFSMAGYLLARASIKKLFKQLDPRLYNGAMFLGLNGIAVKSHGNVDAIGFANAVKVATELAYNNINQQIIDEINLLSCAIDSKNDDEDNIEDYTEDDISTCDDNEYTK